VQFVVPFVAPEVQDGFEIAPYLLIGRSDSTARDFLRGAEQQPVENREQWNAHFLVLQI